jgi:RimJ/RimL family protein N-acetyltransferase
VVSENSLAKKLYKKLGFVKTGELNGAYKKDGLYLDLETYSLVLPLL